MRDLPWLVIAASLICSPAALAADYVGMSGKQLYGRFCASCHGEEGRGDGPVAPSFSIEVPDLTLIARRAGGSYPRDRVVRIIDGRYVVGAHGSRTMPVWGEDFNRAEMGDPNAQRAARPAELCQKICRRMTHEYTATKENTGQKREEARRLRRGPTIRL